MEREIDLIVVHCSATRADRDITAKDIDSFHRVRGYSSTPLQRRALYALLRALKADYPDAAIKGHRDLSPDVNGNGRVDKWERTKECPCFDAMEEYEDL